MYSLEGHVFNAGAIHGVNFSNVANAMQCRRDEAVVRACFYNQLASADCLVDAVLDHAVAFLSSSRMLLGCGISTSM
jgi:hypothetical protein